MLIKPNSEKVSPLYILKLFESDFVERQFDSLKHSTSQVSLVYKTKQLNVMVPPLELQNQFAAFVKQTDKSKFEIQKSLEKHSYYLIH